MKIRYSFSFYILIFCLIQTIPLCIFSMEDQKQERPLTDLEVSSGIAESLSNYVQQQKILQTQPKTFEQSVETLKNLFGTFKFHRGRFAFNNTEVEIYDQQHSVWRKLNNIGKQPFHAWYNNAIGVVCDSNENANRLISFARKELFNPSNESYSEYVSLLDELPQAIADRIKQRYVFSDLQEWVKEASEVNVVTRLKGSWNVQIDDNSTMLDLKDYMHNMEGIPPLQQNLQAEYGGSIWTLWAKRQSYPLEDNRYVKEVMNTYNTNRFVLWLSLRPRTTNN